MGIYRKLRLLATRVYHFLPNAFTNIDEMDKFLELEYFFDIVTSNKGETNFIEFFQYLSSILEKNEMQEKQ